MVARVSLGTNELYLNILPSAARQALMCLKTSPLLTRGRWYLGGGTALPLLVGHRQSVDLDFFLPNRSFKEDNFLHELEKMNNWKLTHRESGTIYGLISNAKVSFMTYPSFRPSKDRMRFGNIRILFPHDIAAMKIIAISQRGRKRDFLDLYWYIHHRESLENVMNRALKQYPGQENNLPHILKSLIYFEDAENDPMPRIFFNAQWKTVKTFFSREIPLLTRKMIGLRGI